MSRCTQRTRAPRRQAGAVLYIALIMLILLALIGLAGMQVAGMQERMASNYRAINVAFQSAEGTARRAECSLEDLVNRTTTAGCGTVTPTQTCDDGFDPLAWAEERDHATPTALNTRLIGPCISGNTSLAMGSPVNEDPNPIYQITAFATDEADLNPGVGNPRGAPSSSAVVDTIFRP